MGALPWGCMQERSRWRIVEDESVSWQNCTVASFSRMKFPGYVKYSCSVGIACSVVPSMPMVPFILISAENEPELQFR